MPALVVLLRHCDNVLRVDTVLADTADGGPPHVSQQRLDLLGGTTVREVQAMSLDPCDELFQGWLKRRLVRDERAPSRKDPVLDM